MERLDTTAFVDTPERVRFHTRLAGPGPRGVAYGIDAAIRSAVLVGGVVAAVMLALIPGLAGMGVGALLVGLFLLEWFYGIIFETWWNGRTPGKWVMSLRVVRTDGTRATFADIALRNLLRTVDFLPGFFGLGALSMWMDPRMRRIGDLVAGTVVVREERSRVLQPVVIDPPVTDEERHALPARVHLSRQEVSLIERFLRRSPSLGPVRSEELAALFGPALSERTGIEAENWTRVLTLAYARATGKDRG